MKKSIVDSCNTPSILRKIRKLKQEEVRNEEFLHITINENQLSKTANSFLNSKLSERYYFGAGENGIVDFGSYTFVGMPKVEDLATSAG